MTPHELRSRRRDRDLRKQWLQQKHAAEIKQLRTTLEGIRELRRKYTCMPDLQVAEAIAIELLGESAQSTEGAKG